MSYRSHIVLAGALIAVTASPASAGEVLQFPRDSSYKPVEDARVIQHPNANRARVIQKSIARRLMARGIGAQAALGIGASAAGSYFLSQLDLDYWQGVAAASGIGAAAGCVTGAVAPATTGIGVVLSPAGCGVGALIGAVGSGVAYALTSDGSQAVDAAGQISGRAVSPNYTSSLGPVGAASFAISRNASQQWQTATLASNALANYTRNRVFAVSSGTSFYPAVLITAIRVNSTQNRLFRVGASTFYNGVPGTTCDLNDMVCASSGKPWSFVYVRNSTGSSGDCSSTAGMSCSSGSSGTFEYLLVNTQVAYAGVAQVPIVDFKPVQTLEASQSPFTKGVISPGALDSLIAPQLVADLANKVWEAKSAEMTAADPRAGYAPDDRVSPSDVQGVYNEGDRYTYGDAVSPQVEGRVNPSTGLIEPSRNPVASPGGSIGSGGAPSETENELDNDADAYGSVTEPIENASGLAKITDLIGINLSLRSVQCPTINFRYQLLGFYRDISSNVFCDITDRIRPLLSSVLVIVYTIFGFLLFLRRVS